MRLNNPLTTSLSLLTDLYQLTMAYGYWRTGMAEQQTVFHLFFRKNPFKGNFAICAGTAAATRFLESFRFTDEDLAYLSRLEGRDGLPLFETGFLDYLREMGLACDVDMVPEGTVVFPHEPLVRIRGPIIQCQLLETALLNMVNFGTLIATKAARVVAAAEGDAVLEFGLRRAQGIDGALTASRAAYIGGCSATSNVLAGKLYDIPVKGTHAHSWVMAFAEELEAFKAYAQAMPNNCVFLVDTYDTIEGVKKAITVGRRLREQGQELVGIRLDSGDLVALSKAARVLLDAAGFHETKIVASNDLDEYRIRQLKQNGAVIDIWGVGTRLVTGNDQPALGGVFKLAAIRNPGEPWSYRIKKSEDPVKTSNPGMQQIRRLYQKGKPVADVIYNQPDSFREDEDMVCIGENRGRSLPDYDDYEDLLQPVFRDGVLQNPPADSLAAREIAVQNRTAFHIEGEGYAGPRNYPVALSESLHGLRQRLIEQTNGSSPLVS